MIQLRLVEATTEKERVHVWLCRGVVRGHIVVGPGTRNSAAYILWLCVCVLYAAGQDAREARHRHSDKRMLRPN